MAGISQLLQILRDEKRTPMLVAQKLRSDSARKGLRNFLRVLRSGIEVGEGGRLGVESWSRQQIEATVSVVRPIIAASLSTPVENAEPVVLAILGDSIELCTCLLEKSTFESDNFSLQNALIEVLEIALVEGKMKDFEACKHPGDTIEESLPITSVDLDFMELDDYPKYNFRGVDCLKSQNPRDSVLMVLTSDCFTGFTEQSFPKSFNSVFSLSQYWAVSHVKCLSRLLMLSKEWFLPSSTCKQQAEDVTFCLKLSLSLRVLKLLIHLTKDIPLVGFDADLLCIVACIADGLPNLFKLESELSECESSTAQNSFWSLLLNLLEEFLQFVQIAFCDNVVYHNVRTSMAASILGALDSGLWRYNAYFPQVVMHLLKLIGDIKNQKSQLLDTKKVNVQMPDSLSSCESHIFSCHVNSEVSLLRSYTTEEHLRIIFPSSREWVDDFVHLAYFLHSEGVRSRIKTDIMRLTCAKSIVSDLDSTTSHEEEAIFGDLFSEACRPVGSSDGHDQLPIIAAGFSSSLHVPVIAAAIELLNFLKLCIFSPDWNYTIFSDACKKFSDHHIDNLLSMLLCQTYPDDRPANISGASTSQGTLGHANEVCFELLHNLLVHHVLSTSLEEHLVDQILMVNNGKYMYNDYTLALLAHALISTAGLSGSHLATKIYKAYGNYIIERTKEIFSGCPELTELFGTLPNIFHIEILLMAFHLSNEVEKSALASFVLLSLREVNSPPEGCSTKQLSCWALLVSRLILLLRHLVLHPATCPSWLLLRLRSKLRESSSRSCFSHNSIESYSSWVSIETGKILGDHVSELPVVNSLLPQLIDVAAFPLPASLCRDNDDLQLLSLDCNDMFATFSWILRFWGSRKAEAVEDLLLERYLFMLCWDTWLCVGSFCSQFQLKSDSEIQLSSMPESFLNFGNFLLNHNAITSEGINPSAVVMQVLQQLHSAQVLDCNLDQGWDFLRNGSWLSLVLSVLHAGVWMYSVRNHLSGIDSFWIENSTKDCKFLNAAEGTVISLTESGKLGWLLNFLLSCLKQQLQIFQEAFLYVLDGKRDHRDGFSSLLLFKNVLVVGRGQNDILEKCSSKNFQMNSMFCLLSKLDEVATMENTGITARVLYRCLLHGFPSHSNILVDIIYTVDGLLKIKYFIGDTHFDGNMIHEILESIMTIKSDVIFRSIHGKCDSIYGSIAPSLDGNLDYSSLYELKHILGFLSELNCHDVTDASIHETLIIAALDKAECLRRDQSKADVFNFFLGTGQNAFKAVEKYIEGNKCSSETVNLKVLSFLVDLLTGTSLYPGFKEALQKRLLEIDLSSMSLWLEKRLLGYCVESPGGVISRESSAALRESTMNFLSCIISQPCEMMSRELRSRFVEAMLLSLENAFTLYDLNTAKAFFTSLVQLLGGESPTKKFLERILLLIEKLAEREDLLPNLKFLFSFLGAVLGDSGASKNVTNKISEKLSSSSSFGVESLVSRQISRKNPEALALPRNQETDSTNVDCDATSGDEDEDDGTSDGELASVDKEDEDDSNSERALASLVCTFTSSGSNFMEQHWYFCYTCDLTVSKGCCSVCAKVCHRGHRVVYSRSSRFFCDCGAGGVRGSSCQCLKPRKFAGGSNSTVRSSTSFKSLLPFSEDGDQAPESDSDLDGDVHADVDSSFKFSIPREMLEVLPTLLEDVDAEKHVLRLCSKLAPAVISKRESNLSKEKKVVLGHNKVVSYNTDVFQLKKAFKGGSLDLKIKADYANSRDLKSHLVSGSLVKSLLSTSTRGRLAVGEGDKVAIFDASQLVGQPAVAPVSADKSSVKPVSRNIVRFEIVHLLFNPIVENYLAVAGYEECQVLTLNSRGDVTDRLAIELALQHGYIRRVDWVPGSQVHLLVVTNMFVKIYDLSQDNISPVHYFTLTDDVIVDASIVTVSMGRLCILVLAELGSLFRLELSVEGDVGAKPLNEVIRVQGRDVQPKGHSLYFSPVHRLLFLSYQDGTTLIGRLDASAMSFTEMSAIYEDEEDGKTRPAGLHHWRELLIDNGVFVCFSSIKSNAALSISFGDCELVAQNMRYVSGPVLPLVGITAYKPLSKDKSYCLVLQDDGSLQIYSHVPVSTDKLGAGILNSKVHAGMSTDFPLDFFEKTICITGDIKLSGDAIKNNDSEGAKQRLQSEDGFLESPSPSGFKITVSNLNPDVTMVGIRVQVGNISVNLIPADITVFQRVIKLDEGMRSWYDIPFTTSESLVSDEEFTISIGPTFDGSSVPRIDSLEIYGQSKDEFGWKQKMEAVLNMETHALGANYGITAVRKKCQTMQAASVQEQVLADALNLLSRLYSSCRSWTCSEVEEANLELSKVKCKDLLETIFQSDREPLLQTAASHVLKSIVPRREIYHHVKDTMRLLGVINTLPRLRSRIGVGGAAAGWVIKEFMAQLRAVSRIALHRRSNMVSFLETHGSEVVDGLMEVLWGILDLERPDTQTVNNIVIPSVDLIYCYAECLTLHGSVASGCSVAAAAVLLKKLLFAPYETVQTASSLAISSRLLQVPFPKQMMLAPDDAGENVAAANVPSDVSPATGGNAHVMIEEDANISSVQYCCDGCSTVPILRRRWHCNVCPDFDLCETCYELLDADQLPPPHSKDHPMSAIPIEIDSVGGDGRGVLFAMDELSDTNLIQVATDINMQNSPSSIHVSESIESGDFPPEDQRFVSISASKRAVNSLLLQQLISELKGWMETTPGFRGIPIMQLFYRLFSAVSGPFMDSSQPENLDLRKSCQMGRTSFGEVTILVFMFFTLMLRNWHQPGGESSQVKSAAVAETQEKGSFHIPSNSSFFSRSSDDQEKNEFVSQLTRACSSLRQQAFVNYLMDILQQLVWEFKSSRGSVDNSHGLSTHSGCGSLLTIRKEIPAGNFSPFFSDSYAKAHKSDLFMDYHRLLLENTFRLVYGLVRPEKHDKCLVKEKTHRNSSGKELKLDGYQDVLCGYICNPHTTFVRRYARRLLLHLCGSKTQYYQVRDSWQFSNEVRKLYKLVNKSSGFQNPVPYETSVKLVNKTSELAKVLHQTWDILSFLTDGIFCFGEESVIQTLKLLTLAFYTGKDTSPAALKAEAEDGTGSSKVGSQSSDSKKKRKGDDGSETGSEKSYLDMEQAVGIFYAKEGSVLQRFIDSFLLEWNSTSLRAEAKSVLYGIWHHGKKPFQETLLTALLEKVKILPMYGQNTVEYTELLISLLGKVPDGSGKPHEAEVINQCLTPDVINCIFETLHSQNELLANHPNSRIYSTLGGLVEFDGYYLESDPCIACSCPEVPYSRMKLESLKSETKFTDNRIIVKCTGSHTIQTVTMNVHDARKSRSVKVLNLYYNNTPVADLSELKNNWSMWKRAKSCHLAFNQTELKVDFPIPITACNFMIELDSFYESLQASSLESLQCPRCSRSVTDKHGICSHCHENAYQCRQCRNINYENLNSFLCNECGYSKYGRFEFNFMAKPSFVFDDIENDEDMKKVLAAIESESENAHRRYQQLLGFKKPLLKLVSSIGEHEIDSQQKDTVQQMVVSLPGPSCKINRKIALLGVLYGEKCKGAFDSVSKSVQMLQGLRQVLMSYLNQKGSDKTVPPSRLAVSRLPNNCYGCAATFATQCMELLQVLSKNANCRKQLVGLGVLSELFENNIHQGPRRPGDANAVAELNNLIQKKVMYCLEHHRSMDISQATREELFLLSETCSLVDESWEARLRVSFKLLFSSIKFGAKHPAISEHVILPCLRIVSQACTPPKTDKSEKEEETGKSGSLQSKNDPSVDSSVPSSKLSSELSEKSWDGGNGQDIPLLSYSEWERGASYLDFVRRQYRFSQSAKSFKSAAEYFELFFKMIESEAARLFLTAKGCLATLCRLITEEVSSIHHSCYRFMRAELISQILEALLVIRGLILQKTKLISDCNRLLKELLDGFLLESSENKRLFTCACISGLQIHSKERKGRTSLFILEQLCNVICPSKPEPVYLLNLNKSHTQEEFIRGSMTKNPYSSNEIGLLMRDVKNKICNQLDLLGLLEDDYGMELLVAGNIISLDLSIAQVYEQVWKKSYAQSQNAVSGSALLSSVGITSGSECPPMTVTYRLQGLDGEATEPMIKELEEDREESQDPEVEFAIAGAVRECGGLEVILSMIQRLSEEDLKSNQEELSSVLNLLMYCCKIRENRRALLQLGALGCSLRPPGAPSPWMPWNPQRVSSSSSRTSPWKPTTPTSASPRRRRSGPPPPPRRAGEEEQAKIVLMFLERLSHPSGTKKSHKQQRNDEMGAPGEPPGREHGPAGGEAEERPGGLRQGLRVPQDELLWGEAQGHHPPQGHHRRRRPPPEGEFPPSTRAAMAGFKLSAEWAQSLKLPSVPLILSMLRGISRGHQPTQACIDEAGLLPLLHALEGNLLDTLSDKETTGDGFLGEKVRSLRHATRDEMRRRALRKRQELLQGLGMRQEVASDGGERIVVSRPSIEGLEEVEEEEEDGLACMVCREGYSLRPGDALGRAGDCVYTTVSHFNVIHFQCHHEAKRADAALKNPKKEWEGAALRNNETLCNSVFPSGAPPSPSPSTSATSTSTGRTSPPSAAPTAASASSPLMLARFATGASFSADSRGGGKESNARFLPFMVQMAAHLLEQGSSSGQQRRTLARSVAAYLTPRRHLRLRLVPAPRHLPAARPAPRLRAAAAGARPPRRALRRRQADPRLRGADRAAAVLLQAAAQSGRRGSGSNSSSSSSSGRGSGGGGLERWELAMKERLGNVKEMAGFSKELLPWLEDMTSAESLQEAFDVMGLLGDVLSAGDYPHCEAFVAAAVQKN
ncbi:unnamed protein product [Spirodela intermedia]|uniref:Auxin transport protein BIG n=1 Tax=Spirodela intermedia TaxID=51605 RepID=A0A7I8IWJ2_SPIIN|nr:unnamed protein product [Spirodela intermedia]CAA6661511.1 unnamed protein product [Spirodela intermedia]